LHAPLHESSMIQCRSRKYFLHVASCIDASGDQGVRRTGVLLLTFCSKRRIPNRRIISASKAFIFVQVKTYIQECSFLPWYVVARMGWALDIVFPIRKPDEVAKLAGGEDALYAGQLLLNQQWLPFLDGSSNDISDRYCLERWQVLTFPIVRYLQHDVIIVAFSTLTERTRGKMQFHTPAGLIRRSSSDNRLPE